MNKQVMLHHGDCLEVMKSIESGSVDMVLTDPPYGTTQNKWDSVVDLELMWQELKRIVKVDGAIVFTACNPFSSALIMSNPKMFKYDWVWQKPKGTGHLNAKKQPMRDKEDILIFYRKQCTYNPQMTEGEPYDGNARTGSKQQTSSYGKYRQDRENNTGFRYPKQVQKFGVVERGTLHPTQKPVALMEYLIKTYTNESCEECGGGGFVESFGLDCDRKECRCKGEKPVETVLDFTMGSGTTGVACKNLNRNFIGIELDENYFNIAKDRIESI